MFATNSTVLLKLAPVATSTKKATKQPSKPSSAKVKRLRKLQGQYMGHIRALSTADKAKVKAIKDKDGLEAGISAAKKLKK